MTSKTGIKETAHVGSGIRTEASEEHDCSQSLLEGEVKDPRRVEKNELPRSDFSAIPLRLLGFGVLMGWHFLLLYFPLPIAEGNDLSGVLFQRQIVLNCSLGIFFVVFGKILDVFLPQEKEDRPFLLVGSACVATIGSLVAVFSTLTGAEVLTITSVVAMGAGEAMLMLLWLRFYSETSVNYSGRYLAASMVIGSLICYFTRHLTTDLSLMVIVVLPVISGAMLYLGGRHAELRDEARGGRGIPDWHSARKPFVRSTTQLVVYSFIFGMFQGSVAPDGTALFAVSEPYSVLGVGIAGILLTCLYWSQPIRPNLSIVHKISILLLVAGLMMVPFSSGIMAYVAATATMTGFILLDLLSLILMVDLIRTFDLKPGLIIGMNRGCEYGAFAVGIGVGFLLWGRFSEVALFPFAIACISVLVGITVTLVLVDEKDIWSAEFYSPQKTFEDEDGQHDNQGKESQGGRWRGACRRVCETYSLSPRESEILFMVAKGRNAEYIQNALFISNHTAKTHVSNIYRKLDIHSAQELLDIVEGTKEQ